MIPLEDRPMAITKPNRAIVIRGSRIIMAEVGGHTPTPKTFTLCLDLEDWTWGTNRSPRK